MALLYTTKDGDMLDWICWKHYGQSSKLLQAAYALDPRLAQSGTDLEEQVLALGQFGGSNLQGIVEQVLEANPGLVHQGLVFKAGIHIYLPDITQEVEDSSAVRLWSD